MSSFDPNKYLIKVGGKDYLPVPARIQWFRDDHPQGQIDTEVIDATLPLVRAVIYDEDGHRLASSHASAFDKSGGKAVWSGRAIEKAETAAIGRALGAAGYGTQFAGDEFDDSDNLSDSPQERRQNAPQTPQNAQKPAGPVVVANPMADAFTALNETHHVYDDITGLDARKEAFRTDVKRLKLPNTSSAQDIIAAIKLDVMPRMAEAVSR